MYRAGVCGFHDVFYVFFVVYFFAVMCVVFIVFCTFRFDKIRCSKTVLLVCSFISKEKI